MLLLVPPAVECKWRVGYSRCNKYCSCIFSTELNVLKFDIDPIIISVFFHSFSKLLYAGVSPSCRFG